MAEARPRLRARGDDPSCPLCRQPLADDDLERWSCPGCAVDYHADCAHELGGCSTLGCHEQGEGPAVSLADEILAAVRARALLVEHERAPDTHPAGPGDPQAEPLTAPLTDEERAQAARDREGMLAWARAQDEEALRAWARAQGYTAPGRAERDAWGRSLLAWTGLWLVVGPLVVIASWRDGGAARLPEALGTIAVLYLFFAVPMLVAWRWPRS